MAFDLLEDGVEAGAELSPMFQFSQRSCVVRLFPHLFTLGQHLGENNTTIYWFYVDCNYKYKWHFIAIINLEQTKYQYKRLSAHWCCWDEKKLTSMKYNLICSILCNLIGSILCNLIGSILYNLIGSILYDLIGSILYNLTGSILCNLIGSIIIILLLKWETTCSICLHHTVTTFSSSVSVSILAAASIQSWAVLIFVMSTFSTGANLSTWLALTSAPVDSNPSCRYGVDLLL